MKKQEFDHSFTFKGHSSIAKKALKYGISISQTCRDALAAAVDGLGKRNVGDGTKKRKSEKAKMRMV